MKTLFKNARLLPEYGYADKPVFIAVNGSYIAKISDEALGECEYDTIVDCRGNLLIPAFYNAHCHVAMTLFRGFGEDLPLADWLEKKIFPAEDRLTYERVFLGSKLGIAEMIRAGIVSFTDMYMFEDAVADAVLETGIKANLSRSIASFDESIGPENDYRLKESIKLYDTYHGAGEGRVLVDFALHAEYTNHARACRYVAEEAKKRDLRMQVHLSETKKEHEECKARRGGKTPAEFFLDCGVFDLPTTAAHCVWVEDSDLDIFLDKKVFVAHNPVSNLKLGSGVMPLAKFLRRGVSVALGTDGAASNNRLDLLRELQIAALLDKGTTGNPAGHTAKELFPLATENGALSQGRTDCGRIEEGKRADLVLLNLNSLHNQPVYDPYATLTYSMGREDVLLTMADGRILYQNGEYTSIDEERLKYEFQKTVAHYFD
ncbi:MAG: amidohydrolase [Clostridia bacterium]|nr:amidohydrolase [Clostridia bacterium]